MKNWPFSFSALIEAVSRGGRDARAHLTDLARHRPYTVLPYARELAALLDSTRGPIRKASIETLAALSRISPAAMAFLLPKLHALLASEPQNVVVNHAIEILVNYGKTSARAAKKVMPILRDFGDKNAKRVKKALDELTSESL
ncbi:MAG: hypothetical protein ACHQNE_06025 [Candidatus Kapaibacterium sp.]